jgi:hypothetical protein
MFQRAKTFRRAHPCIKIAKHLDMHSHHGYRYFHGAVICRVRTSKVADVGGLFNVLLPGGVTFQADSEAEAESKSAAALMTYVATLRKASTSELDVGNAVVMIPSSPYYHETRGTTGIVISVSSASATKAIEVIWGTGKKFMYSHSAKYLRKKDRADIPAIVKLEKYGELDTYAFTCGYHGCFDQKWAKFATVKMLTESDNMRIVMYNNRIFAIRSELVTKLIN